MAHSKQQQVRLEELEAELLGRPTGQPANGPAIQSVLVDDSDASTQLLAQVSATHIHLRDHLFMSAFAVNG